MSFRPVRLNPVAAPHARANPPASMDRLNVVLQTGMALAPKLDGVSIEVKRQMDGSFVLSPAELQTIIDTDDLDDLPVALRKAYKTIPRPVPKLVGTTGRYRTKIYLLTTERLKRLYLRYRAADTFREYSLDQFYGEAWQGGYGDVNEGDWEAAGIKPEDSVEFNVANKLLGTLDEQWELIEKDWMSKGLDMKNKNYVLEEGEGVSDYAERFDQKYHEHIQEYLDTGRDLNALEKVLNDFVDSMMAKS